MVGKKAVLRERGKPLPKAEKVVARSRKQIPGKSRQPIEMEVSFPPISEQNIHDFIAEAPAPPESPWGQDASDGERVNRRTCTSH
jgi:hypothetical protein